MPIQLAYDRLARSATATIAVEIERLLGIQDYFFEEIYVLVRVRVNLPKKPGRAIDYSEAIQFDGSESSGQGLKIRSFRQTKKKPGWLLPGHPVLAIEGLELTVSLEDRSSWHADYVIKRGIPEFIYCGNRDIRITPSSLKRFPFHGARIAKVAKAIP